jgi:fucose 4-O-acetylase-like acetyltransferase
MCDEKERLSDIDRETGLAISMVAFGHCAKDQIHSGIEWYNALKYVLCNVHMAFFLYLSGIVTCYSYKPVENLKNHTDYVYKKSMRFIPAYFLFSVLIILVKHVTSGSCLPILIKKNILDYVPVMNRIIY